MIAEEKQTAERGFIDRFFSVTERHTRIRTEILAGVSIYLSLAYIFIVNPAILSKAGMSISAVFFATIIASAATTIFMGLYARQPFALAPGLEINGFVAFVVVGTLGFSWQEALGAVFWSGVLCFVLSVLPVRRRIIDAIPVPLQSNLAVSVGVFVMVVGLVTAKILAFKSGMIDFDKLGSPVSKEAMALWVGLGLAFLFNRKIRTRHGSTRVLLPGGFLFAILVATVYCQTQGIVVTNPTTFSAEMFSAINALDWAALFSPKLLPVFLVLFLIDFYGSIGKFIGLTASTPELRAGGQSKEIKRMKEAMVVDGVGTMGGAFLGTTSIITYVVSAVGIKEGGRTGITAIVCGVLMLLSLAFTPLVGLVPVVATAGVLVYVGWLLLPHDEIRTGAFGRFDIIVGVAMALVSLLTFSLDKAMLVGFGCYAIRQAVHEKINWWLMGSFLVLFVGVVLQYILN